MIGKVMVTATEVIWVPLGKQRWSKETLVIGTQSIARCEVLKPRIPSYMDPIAIFVGEHRLELILSWTFDRRLGHELYQLITSLVGVSRPSDRAPIPLPDLHLTRARLLALFWLLNICLWLGLVAYVGMGDVSILGIIISAIWLVVVARTVITAIPLVLRKGARSN
jgi:hypothetical protein